MTDEFAGVFVYGVLAMGMCNPEIVSTALGRSTPATPQFCNYGPWPTTPPCKMIHATALHTKVLLVMRIMLTRTEGDVGAPCFYKLEEIGRHTAMGVPHNTANPACHKNPNIL